MRHSQQHCQPHQASPLYSTIIRLSIPSTTHHHTYFYFSQTSIHPIHPLHPLHPRHPTPHQSHHSWFLYPERSYRFPPFLVSYSPQKLRASLTRTNNTGRKTSMRLKDCVSSKLDKLLRRIVF